MSDLQAIDELTLRGELCLRVSGIAQALRN